MSPIWINVNAQTGLDGLFTFAISLMLMGGVFGGLGTFLFLIGWFAYK